MVFISWLPPRLQASLARPGHARFRDRVVRAYVQNEDFKELYFILLGLAGELNAAGSWIFFLV